MARPPTKFFTPPFAFIEPKDDNEAPRVVDSRGNWVLTLYWPGHAIEDTEAAEQATYELGRAMADLLNMWDDALPDRAKMT